MEEIRFHGRGGQGVVTAAKLLAAAAFLDGRQAQETAIYGLERRGAPVVSFTRIGDKPIRITASVYEPDCIVVLDGKLLTVVNVAEGLKPDGLAVINSALPPAEVKLPYVARRLATVDANEISRQLFGERPIPITNTAMLGGLAAASGYVSLDALLEAIREHFRGDIAAKNVQAAVIGYRQARIRESEA